MNSAAWAWFSFLVTRGHSSCTRTAVPVDTGCWQRTLWHHCSLGSTDLKPFSSIAQGLCLTHSGSPCGLWPMCTMRIGRGRDSLHGTEACRGRRSGSYTGLLCHTRAVPQANGVLRGPRSHAMVASSNWSSGPVEKSNWREKSKEISLKKKCRSSQVFIRCGSRKMHLPSQLLEILKSASKWHQYTQSFLNTVYNL